MLHAPLFALQGGGLFIQGTATLTNTNVYSNEADSVCSPSALAWTFIHRPTGMLTFAMCVSCAGGELSCESNQCVTCHRPLELTLDLTGCCARARGFGITVCECLHFELSAAFPPSPTGCAHCLRCVVAVGSEFWRQIEPTHVAFQRPNGMLYALGFSACRAGDSTSLARQR